MLLPAVQGAREMGRRSQCSNNLHQIGIAFLAHVDDHDAYPNGGYFWTLPRTVTKVNPMPCQFDQQNWAWGYQILPYIDQLALWSNLDDKVVASTPVALYFCPTRRRPVALSGGSWQVFPYPRAMTDYAGNGGAGRNEGGPWFGFGEDGVVVRQSLDGKNSVIRRPAHITDGLSNTIMVGEKLLNANYIFETEPNDNDGYTTGWDDDIVRWGGPEIGPPIQDFNGPDWTTDNLWPNNFRFGSAHTTGAQFVFCDGSVRLIHYNVNPLTFSHLCCRNDAVPVNPEDL
jgi:prepilin-type processing-associated H-X9-DG protein